MKKLVVPFTGRSHEVWFGGNSIQKLSQLQLLKEASRIFIFADSRLKVPAQKLVREFKLAGLEVRLILLKVSEDLKDIQQVYPLYGELLKNGADRHSVLVALGGGVIGDAIGFIAATYMRGIRWIGIPSTLLSQVDSSLGGKTGINHKLGKNLIGAVHQPSLVVCDSRLLLSLQERDLISGLGEMIKYGLVFDPLLYARLQRNWKKVLEIKKHSESLSFLETDIRTCLEWKSKTVVQDEWDEKGVREVLNFGHTFGHALEAESKYGYFRHGEAILYGMRVACAISVRRGHLNWELQQRIERFLSSIPVPPLPSGISVLNYVRRIQMDKKARNKKVRFVLLKNVGEATLDRDVSDREIRDSIQEIIAK